MWRDNAFRKSIYSGVLTSLLVIFIFGCKTVEHFPAYDLLVGIDFRPYAEKGFLFTTHEYQGKYTTLAMIEYRAMPEATLATVHTQTGVKHLWSIGKVNTQAVLDSIYNHCLDLGADALMEFVIDVVYDAHTNIYNPVTIEGKRITGIAIKREE